MASSSFGDRVNSLGWSRREQTANTSKPSGLYGTLQKLNPFGEQGYVRLPVNETDEGPGAPLPARTRREEEEGWFARKSPSPSIYMAHPLRQLDYAHGFLGSEQRYQRCRLRGMSLDNQARSCSNKLSDMQVILPCVFVPRVGLLHLP
jgi:hypothetical protein